MFAAGIDSAVTFAREGYMALRFPICDHVLLRAQATYWQLAARRVPSRQR